MSDVGMPPVPAGGPAVPAPVAGEPHGRPARAGGMPVDLVLALALAGSGLVVGALWRFLAEVAVKHSQDVESLAAVDLTLAVLTLALGVAVGVLLLVRPGAAPVRRFLLALAGLIAGGALAWATGRLLGVKQLGAVGAAFLAAPATAAIVFGSTLVSYLRDPQA